MPSAEQRVKGKSRQSKWTSSSRMSTIGDASRLVVLPFDQETLIRLLWPSNRHIKIIKKPTVNVRDDTRALRRRLCPATNLTSVRRCFHGGSYLFCRHPSDIRENAGRRRQPKYSRGTARAHPVANKRRWGETRSEPRRFLLEVRPTTTFGVGTRPLPSASHVHRPSPVD